MASSRTDKQIAHELLTPRQFDDKLRNDLRAQCFGEPRCTSPFGHWRSHDQNCPYVNGLTQFEDKFSFAEAYAGYVAAEVRAAEREECAKIADEHERDCPNATSRCCLEIAAGIRSRKD